MPRYALPPHLKDAKHWDWPWPLSFIPRSWTAFKWGEPRLIAGNLWPADFRETIGLPAPLPITTRGTWQISRFPHGTRFALYFAFTLMNGWHFRIGARWDNVDGYVEFPSIAVRRYSGLPIQDTATR